MNHDFHSELSALSGSLAFIVVDLAHRWPVLHTPPAVEQHLTDWIVSHWKKIRRSSVNCLFSNEPLEMRRSRKKMAWFGTQISQHGWNLCIAAEQLYLGVHVPMQHFCKIPQMLCPTQFLLHNLLPQSLSIVPEFLENDTWTADGQTLAEKQWWARQLLIDGTPYRIDPKANLQCNGYLYFIPFRIQFWHITFFFGFDPVFVYTNLC